jgi:hypothetical protein
MLTALLRLLEHSNSILKLQYTYSTEATADSLCTILFEKRFKSFRDPVSICIGEEDRQYMCARLELRL